MNIARFKIDAPDDMSATLTVKLTVKDWRTVRAALDKGKDGWYGPERRVIEALDSIIKQVDQTFYAEELE